MGLPGLVALGGGLHSDDHRTRCLWVMVVGSFLASLWESIGTLLTVLTPLVAVPLTVITFYLRSLREHQVSWHGELIRRIESAEGSALELRKTMAEFERDYTTKEEWLRELMYARRMQEQWMETAARMDATLRTAMSSSRVELRAGAGAGRAGPERKPIGESLRGMSEDNG